MPRDRFETATCTCHGEMRISRLSGYTSSSDRPRLRVNLRSACYDAHFVCVVCEFRGDGIGRGETGGVSRQRVLRHNLFDNTNNIKLRVSNLDTLREANEALIPHTRPKKYTEATHAL